MHMDFESLIFPFQLRHLTLLILSSFPVQLPEPPEGMRDAPSSIFQICLRIERIPLRIQEYRDKLKYLQQLDFNLVQTSLPPGLKFDLVSSEKPNTVSSVSE